MADETMTMHHLEQATHKRSRADLKDLTPEEMARVKALDAAATPGPWENDFHAKRFGSGYTFGPEGEMVADKCDGCDGVRLRGVGGRLPQEQNGDFIAAARTLLPRAVAQIERLQAAHASAFAPKFALKDLAPEDLAQLCDEFREAVFAKALKQDPAKEGK